MMRSLFSGVAGLKAHQAKMDVISNNVANINTVGFKRGSMSFSQSFAQGLKSSSGANDNTGRGGINSSQIGLGVSIGTVSTIMTQGAAQRTDNGNDLMIDGDGFFIVKDSSGYYYTRAGAFSVDAEGNMVDANGYRLCGWEAVDDPDNPGEQKIIQDVAGPLNIFEGDKSYSPASPTSSIKVTGNINPSTNPEQLITFSFYDSVGNSYTATGKLKYNTEDGDTKNTWGLELDAEVTVNGDTKVNMFGQGNTNPVEVPGFALKFQDGVPVSGTELKIENLAWPNNPYNATFSAITIDFSEMTEFNSTVTVSSTTVDGNTSGSMNGYTIDSNGVIIGSYSNGKTKILGQIALADFSNPAGLESVGNNLFITTNNSGDFNLVGFEAGALGSSLISGSLEMSNVDISYEFSEMITTQRGFQASSRIISVGDEMIQELVNLKR